MINQMSSNRTTVIILLNCSVMILLYEEIRNKQRLEYIPSIFRRRYISGIYEYFNNVLRPSAHYERKTMRTAETWRHDKNDLTPSAHYERKAMLTVETWRHRNSELKHQHCFSGIYSLRHLASSAHAPLGSKAITLRVFKLSEKLDIHMQEEYYCFKWRDSTQLILCLLNSVSY